MSGSLDRRLAELFDAARELPEEERRTLIDRECANDPRLRSEIESLLAHAGGELLSHSEDLRRVVATLATDVQPAAVGPYRIEALLGRGGMGEVYLARETGALDRRVALKLILQGALARETLARFELERLTLSRMEHPNIAKVFGAGRTEDSRPYFAMEYVDGTPITRFSDERHLSLNQRLELFLQCCDGVNHAHLRGVIHRDIKPDNVLVSVIDDTPSCKIIDFGIAKPSTGGSRPELTHGHLIGTPGYMSPEQRAGADIDTRSDVYSLGVLLVELLTGRRPSDRQDRSAEPERPSAAVERTSGEDLRRRGLDRRTLRKRLRSELDWICTRALELAPADRYQTVAALAEDIRRHLRGDAVLARPARRGYVIRKFIGRHRLASSLAASALMFLLVLAAMATAHARRLAREKLRADSEAQVANAASEFLIDLFEVSDPASAASDGMSRLGNTPVGHYLEIATRRLDNAFVEQPELRARLLVTLGRIHRNLGYFEQSEAYLSEAESLYLTNVGELDLRTAEACYELGVTLDRLGNTDRTGELFRRALATRGTILGNDDASTLAAAFAVAYFTRDSDPDVRIAELQHVLGSQRRVLGERHEDVPTTLRALGNASWDALRTDDARSYYEQALELQLSLLGDDDPGVTASRNNLAMLLSDRGLYDEALEFARANLASYERTVGIDHEIYADGLALLGLVHYRSGDPEHAREAYERALRIVENSGASSRLASVYYNLGVMQRELGLVLVEDALENFERSLEIRIRLHGPRHLSVMRSETLMGAALVDMGRLPEGFQHYSRALALATELVGSDHFEAATVLHMIGEAEFKAGNASEAATRLRRALEIREGYYGRRHAMTASSLLSLSEALQQLGQVDEAMALCKEAVGIRMDVFGPEHQWTRRAIDRCGIQP